MKNKVSELSVNPMKMFFMLFGITLFSKFIFLIITDFSLNYIWGINLKILITDIGNQNFKYSNALKFITFIDQIGTFFIPSIVLFKLSKEVRLEIKKISLKDFYLIGLLLLCLLSATNVLSLISQNIDLNFIPSAWNNYLKEQQILQENIQSNFIGESLNNFLSNLLIMAITPAICEEFFFRGSLQTILINWSKNKAIGIFITSLIFGALHFQIENFLAIVFASILFGYVYQIKKNIMFTIIIHLLFNSISLWVMHMIKNKVWDDSIVEQFMLYGLVPAGLVAGILLIIKYYKKDKN